MTMDKIGMSIESYLMDVKGIRLDQGLPQGMLDIDNADNARVIQEMRIGIGDVIPRDVRTSIVIEADEIGFSYPRFVRISAKAVEQMHDALKSKQTGK